MPGADGATFTAAQAQHPAGHRGHHGELGLHGLDHHQRVARLHRLAGFDQHAPHAARHLRGHGACAFGHGVVGHRRRRVGLAHVFGLAGQAPALALLGKGLLLGGAEGGNALGFGGQELLVGLQREAARLGAQRVAAGGEVAPDLRQFGRADRVEADLVEEAQQPGLAGFKVGRAVARVAPAVPHLQGAAHKLVAARPLHAIHTQVGAADAHCVFRRPGAGRVVFGGDQAVARVQRRGHRRAQVHIAQAQHQVAGVEHGAVHRVQVGQAVDAADELDVAGAPGRVRPHRLHVLLDRQARAGIVPGQRQPHRARGHAELLGRAQRLIGGGERSQQGLAAHLRRVVVQLQRADAGREVEDAGQPAGGLGGLQRLHQRMHPKAQRNVQHQLAQLHQQVTVASLPHHHGGPARGGRALQQARVGKHRRFGPGDGGRRLQRVHLRLLRGLQRQRGFVADGVEAHRVTRLQLAQLPPLGGHHHGRAHKATQAGAVGAQDHRHVAGEVDGADGVGVVVDVGRVQARLAAVVPRPLRLGADQSHAGAAGVVMHLPVGGEEAGNVGVGEKIWRAVRAVEHADLPSGLQHWRHAGGQRCGLGRSRRLRAHVQQITRAQRAPAMAAKLAQGKGGGAAQIQRHIEAAAHRQRGAQAGALHRAQPQHCAGRHGHGLVQGQRRDRAIGRLQRGVQSRAHQRHQGVGMGAQGGAAQGDFQRGRRTGIAHQAVGQAMAQRVHRPAGRHAHVPVVQAAGPVLHAGLHAGLQHLQRLRCIAELAQAAGDQPAFDKLGLQRQRPQVAQIGLDAGQAGVGQGLLQLGHRFGAVAAGDDELGDHRVVVRRHLAAARHPGLDARIGRELHLGEQAGAGLELARRVFGIQAHLDGGASRGGHLQREVVTTGQLHHPGHQVDAGDLLGHAVLHLQPGVHLQEVEGAGVGVQHVLHRAGRAVGHGAAQAQGRVDQRGARFGRQVGGRSFFHHLLVAALGGTVALAQGHHLPAAVTEQLHLDVAGALDELFQEQACVLEVGTRQTRHSLEGRCHLGRVADQPHADAAATGRALEHHRVANALGLAAGLGQVGQQAAAGQQWHTVGQRQLARGVLQAEGPHLRGRGADEGDAGGLAGLGKTGVLRQKAVAGVDGTGAGLLCRGQDGLGVQVALRGRGRPDADGHIGLGHVGRVGIGLGIHGHRLQAQGLEAADDAAGDGAAVGDQDGVERRHGGVTSCQAAGRPARKSTRRASRPARVRNKDRSGTTAGAGPPQGGCRPPRGVAAAPPPAGVPHHQIRNSTGVGS